MTEEPPAGPGRLQPTRLGSLAACAVAGLVLGWLVRRVFEALERPVPLITWSQAGVLFFVAAVLFGAAWITRRAVRDHRPDLDPDLMVNRLVLARACAFVAALLLGGYSGFALSWVGVGSELRTSRIVHALVAALGALLMVVASVLLERACRVRDDDRTP